MNIWSRILLHLRRARLRQRFARQQDALQNTFRMQLFSDLAQERRWHDLEWITDPILHVLPDTNEVPVALVGIAAMYSFKAVLNDVEPVIQTQAGTALFYYQDGGWQSNGKVLLNLTPSEVLHQLNLKSMTCLD